MLEDRELLFNIATLYYRDSLTQQEISQKLNISRPMISRALSKAEAVGIVRIELVPPAGFSDLELELAKKLNLQRVVVAPQLNNHGTERESRIQDIVDCASKLLPELILPGMAVGVGWGVTVYRTVLALQPSNSERKDTIFVPLVGSAGRSESHYQVNVIVDRMAEKLKGNATFFNIPAFVRSQQLMDYVLGDPQLKTIQSVWAHLDIAIVGLGAFGGTPSFPVGDYSQEELEELRNLNVVGDILGRFFNDEGFISDSAAKETYFPKNTSSMPEQVYLGIPADDLRKAKNVICLCGGTQKVPSIRVAARQGLFNFLVTDTVTAKELVEA